MRSSRGLFIVAAIFGSFLIYCGQSAINHALDSGAPDGAIRADGSSLGDGFVRDARAQSGECCVPLAYSFTKIGEDTIGPREATQAFDVSAYREIVVYMSKNCGSSAFFKASPTSDVATGGRSIASGAVRVLGNFVKITTSDACPTSTKFAVYGVK